jgi:hypothetical protein
VWWQWTQKQIADARFKTESKVENSIESRFDAYTEAVGEVIGTGWRTQREQWQKEDGAIQSRLELLQREVAMLRERQEQEDALTRYEVGVARRELATLRQEVALERGFQALKAEIAAAKAEIPKFGDLESRVETKQSALAAEQKRLEQELAKQKDRLGKMRVNQSIEAYRLSQFMKQQEAAPAVELQFETSESSFAVKDLHPQAAASWREFVSGLMSSRDNEGASLRFFDPAGDAARVISLPVRRPRNAV